MLPADYQERVYAGVLGKLIGVYLGRPVESWTYQQISERLGELGYYVNRKLDVPLVVADDDISGTFTFLRALPDYGNHIGITPEQIGQTWLNYLIENRTVLWWGGLGNSTEHTAYLRLKQGIPAPRSGSIELNSKVVAEQIGAQIFIDGWGMVAPGNPDLAADLARRAASVSHDGEAIYGAQVLAVMEALAFVESDLNRLLDTAVSYIPKDSVIYRMIAELREKREQEPDWRQTRQWLEEHYGYHIYGGNCHMVPNHGVIILGLLYGEGNFQKSLMITNTCGWDTDCNSGNVGCLLGIWQGLAGIEAGPDWRGPVADRLFLPTADGGRCITDAVSEAFEVINMGRALVGEPAVAPKGGARFHFEMPGAVQGFQPDAATVQAGTLLVENTASYSINGNRSLALRFQHVADNSPARVATPTFIPPAYIQSSGYGLYASPTLYPGQRVRARVCADVGNKEGVFCRLFISVYGHKEALTQVDGPVQELTPGMDSNFSWHIPDTGGQPIAEIGLEITSPTGDRVDGVVYLDYLTWDGVPEVRFSRPETGGSMWHRAWTNGVDYFGPSGGAETYRLVQDSGIGLAIQGTREWADYVVSAPVSPHMVETAGIAARVQGMRRYYSLLMCRDGHLRLVKALDGYTVLAEKPYAWEYDSWHTLTLAVNGPRLQAYVNDKQVFDIIDNNQPLESGAVAMLGQEGRCGFGVMQVRPE